MWRVFQRGIATVALEALFGLPGHPGNDSLRRASQITVLAYSIGHGLGIERGQQPQEHPGRRQPTVTSGHLATTAEKEESMRYQKRIDNYQLFYASYPKFNEWKANLYLCQGPRLVVDLRLVDEPGYWASAQRVTANSLSLIYDDISKLPVYLSVLRFEKPLYAVLWTGQQGDAPFQLMTDTVSVGHAGGTMMPFQAPHPAPPRKAARAPKRK